MRTIHKLLVANRGEIARRVFSTCRSLGIRTVAVYSEADADAAHVSDADEAVHIGPPPAAESYLDVAAILEAARLTGADAIHPGYGFLSENAAFARAVNAAGLIWVGPPAECIDAMGDKAAARRIAVQHEVPVVPGYDGEDDDATLRVEAARIGVPLLVKASAGGGGRGMRQVHDLVELDDAIASARREAVSSFGSGRLILERYVERPRHIEVQIFADAHGRVVHLFERECSIQRRHQKVVEEAPSPAVSPELRERMGQAAIRVAEAVGYVGAGTVELLLSRDGSFYFLEMNTRLQVEHPVTECITGLDLVALQLAVAEGQPLPADVGRSQIYGHAIEVRLYAEDPLHDYMPASGRLVRLYVPGAEGVRVDSGFGSGDVVGVHYDAMLAKIIAHGPDRRTASRRLRRAVEGAWVPGLVTNLPLLRQILADEAWESGDLDTGFLPRRGLPKAPPTNLERGALVAATMAWWWGRGSRTADEPAGWRLWGRQEDVGCWAYLDQEVEVGTVEDDGALLVRVGDAEPVRVTVISVDGDEVRLDLGGRRHTVRIATTGPELRDDEAVYVHLGDGEAMVRRLPRLPAPAGVVDEPGSCVAPTPGVVRQVHVEAGDTVCEGDLLVTMEAMKMEHAIRSPLAGVVAGVRVAVGDAVDQGTLMVVLEPDDA